MVDQSIVMSVQKYFRLLRDQGISVVFGVVFGSQAEDRADHWSDIDLLVVSPVFDEHRDGKDVSMLWRLAARADNRIEPIPCGEKQWREDDTSPILEMARRRGQRIAAQ